MTVKVGDLNVSRSSSDPRKPAPGMSAFLRLLDWFGRWEREQTEWRRRGRLNRFNEELKRDLDHGRA